MSMQTKGLLVLAVVVGASFWAGGAWARRGCNCH